MPFEETHVVDERTRFVEEVQRSARSFTAICDRYGISRTAGYKWLDRWKTEGPAGLEDRSSRPRACPWATPADVVEAILRGTPQVLVGRRPRGWRLQCSLG